MIATTPRPTTPNAPLDTAADTAVVRLTELSVGESARLYDDTQLVGQEREMLAALGLDNDRRFRLCKAGNPCIIQVRATRIGLSEEVARHLLVLPEDRPR